MEPVAKAPLPKLALLVIFLTKLYMNTAFRWPYPFITFIARRLDVATASVTRALSLTELAGFVGPAAGFAAGRIGKRNTVLLSLFLSVTAHFLLVPIIYVSRVLTGISTFLIMPLLQATVGAIVVPERQATATGMVELSWGGAGTAGVPLMGALVGAGGLWVGAAALTAWGVLSLALSAWRLPRDSMQHAEAQPRAASQSQLDTGTSGQESLHAPQFGAGSKPPGTASDPSVRGANMMMKAGATPPAKESFFPRLKRALSSVPSAAALIYALLINLCSNLLFSTYGRWLDLDRGFNIENVGYFTVILGLGELTGASSCALGASRFGARRVMAVSVTLMAAGCLGMGLSHNSGNGDAGGSIAVPIFFLFATFLFFESALITSLSMATALPGHTTVETDVFLPVFTAFFSIGRLIAVAISDSLYDSAGFGGVCFVAAGVSAASILPIMFTGERFAKRSHPLPVLVDVTQPPHVDIAVSSSDETTDENSSV